MQHMRFVDPNDFAVPVAMSGGGAAFHQIKDGRPECDDLACPVCEARVTFVSEARDGGRAAHFRHIDETNCNTLADYHRGVLHDAIADAAARMLNGKWKARDMCLGFGKAPMPTGAATREKTANYGGTTYRPDITVDPKPGENAVTLELEVVFSHKPAPKRVAAAWQAQRMIATLNISAMEAVYWQAVYGGTAFELRVYAEQFLEQQKFLVMSDEAMDAVVRGTARLEYGIGQVPLRCKYTGLTLRKPNGDACLPSEFPHGIGIGGMPLTWTGKLVSWKDWDALTEWDKYGPQGRVWDGLTQSWAHPIRGETTEDGGPENAV